MLENKKKDNMTIVRKRYELNPSRDIDDKGTLNYKWSRGTPSQNQARVVVLDVSFLYVYLHALNYKYWFFLSSTIAHQRNLQCDWMREKNCHTQTKVVFLHANFPWWLKTLQSDCMRQNWLHKTKTSSLKSYRTLITFSMPKS